MQNSERGTRIFKEIYCCHFPYIRDQFDEFKAISLIGPQDRNGEVEALDCQRRSDQSYHNGHHRQSHVHNALTPDWQPRQSEFRDDMTHMDLSSS